MTIKVQGPNGTVVEFPDGTDAATINRAMQGAAPAPSVKDVPVYRNPEPSWVPQTSGWDAFSYGVGQGASFNMLDEAQALTAGAPGSPEYDAELNRQRAFIHAAQEQHPNFYGAGNATGSIPAALIPVGKVAQTAGPIAKTLVGGGTAAVQGGLAGFGAGEGAEDRLSRARQAALIAGGLGAAIPVVGGASGAIARKLGKSKTAPGAGVVPTKREALSNEFKVPLTSGQKTGNISQQASEEAMAHDARGQIPTRIMKDFRERQIAANRDAAEQIGQSAAKRVKVETPADAGELAISGVKGRAARLKAQSQAAYDVAEKGNLTLQDNAVRDAVKNVELRLINNDVTVAPDLHPSAMYALKEIEQLASLKPGNRGAQINPASLEQIEKTRRSINSMKGINDDDRRVLGEVKDAFDSWLDDAVDNSLFSGDPAALGSLKDARKLWRDYRNITTGRGPDEANRKIASFFQKDVTGQEVANWMTGASALGGSGTAYRTASKLKSVLGPDSDEWGAVRQGVWLSLTKGANPDGGPGPQKMANTLYEFLEGKGKPLATVLYTPAERAKMLRYAELQKAMVPDPKATNPSKSSYGMMRQAGPAAWSTIASTLGATGFAVGDVPGGIAAVVAATSVPVFRQARAISAAKSAVAGKIKPSGLVSKTLQTTNRAVTPAVVNSIEDRNRKPLPPEVGAKNGAHRPEAYVKP